MVSRGSRETRGDGLAPASGRGRFRRVVEFRTPLLRRLGALALAAAPLGAGACSGPDYTGDGGAEPTVVVPVHDVIVRNNCLTEVELALGVREPKDSFKLGSGRVERLRLRPQDRVWLRYRGEWSRKRATSPPEDGWIIEVREDCAAVTGRRGPL